MGARDLRLPEPRRRAVLVVFARSCRQFGNPTPTGVLDHNSPHRDPLDNSHGLLLDRNQLDGKPNPIGLSRLDESQHRRSLRKRLGEQSLKLVGIAEIG